MSAESEAAATNPYPGLRPFREDEEYLFFGREKQVDVMVDMLAATHFLAVAGSSGSGKSSMVNCGLRPSLHRGLMACAGTSWRMAQFRPGSNPLRAMAQALAADGVLYKDFQAADFSLAELTETSLRMSKLGLVDVYQQARLGDDVNLLLVVDQFEELFRYRKLGASPADPGSGLGEDATAFVNLLLEVREQVNCQIYVVLTMRSDFLGDCAQFFGLPEAINKGQFLLPRMSRSERRAAILGPARVGGADIEPVLMTRLTNDVGDNPDQLSILQHALNRTWARWEEKTGAVAPLQLPHYLDIGGMAHALNGHAEEAYNGLGSERKQQICEKIFKTLTDKGTDVRGIRRPTKLGTICALVEATEAEVIEVIDAFREPSRSFLMPPAGERLTAGTVIDISHESLMRVWDKLSVWGDEEAESARQYLRIADSAQLYAAGKAGLWRDPDLQVALDWRDRVKPNATWAAQYHAQFEPAMQFLEQSRLAVQQEALEKVREKAREALGLQQKAEALWEELRDTGKEHNNQWKFMRLSEIEGLWEDSLKLNPEGSKAVIQLASIRSLLVETGIATQDLNLASIYLQKLKSDPPASDLTVPQLSRELESAWAEADPALNIQVHRMRKWALAGCWLPVIWMAGYQIYAYVAKDGILDWLLATGQITIFLHFLIALLAVLTATGQSHRLVWVYTLSIFLVIFALFALNPVSFIIAGGLIHYVSKVKMQKLLLPKRTKS